MKSKNYSLGSGISIVSGTDKLGVRREKAQTNNDFYKIPKNMIDDSTELRKSLDDLAKTANTSFDQAGDFFCYRFHTEQIQDLSDDDKLNTLQIQVKKKTERIAERNKSSNTSSNTLFSKPKNKNHISLLDELSNYILDRMPTDPLWVTTLSLQTLSTVCQNTKFTTRQGEINLNLFSLNVGASGFTYKSSPLKSIINPILRQVSKNLDKELLLPSRFSLEAMIDHLAEQPYGFIWSDEFTQVIKATLSKSYQADIMEFLTELFDCQRQIRRTRSGGLKIIEDPYVSLAAATTPYLYSVIKPDHFQQGIGNRFLYVVSDVKEVYKHNPSTFFSPKEFTDLRTTNEKFADKLTNLTKKLAEENYVFDIKNPEWILNYTESLDKRGLKKYKKNTTDNTYSYYSRAKENFFKILALRSISENYNAIMNSNVSVIRVQERDIEWSIGLMNQYLDNFEQLLQDWQKHDKEKTPVQTLDKYVDYAKEILKAHGGKLSLTDFRAKTKIPQKMFDDVRSILISSNEVKIEQVESKTRPIEYYILNEKS